MCGLRVALPRTPTNAHRCNQAPPKSKRVLIIANHVEAPDWSVIFWIATAVDRIGYVKVCARCGCGVAAVCADWCNRHHRQVVAKSIIRWIPVLGSAMVAMGTGFLSRSWEQDKKKIEATFRHLNARGTPYWLLTHPEGTRFTPARAAESKEFSQQRGLAPLTHVLQPRVKGFSTTVLGLQPSLESVLDVTICWDKPPAPMPGCFMGQGGPRVVHVHLAEFPVAQLPKSEEALQQWLYQRWAEKDRLVASFKATGKFDATIVPVSIPYDVVNPRMFWWQTTVAVLSVALLYVSLL